MPDPLASPPVSPDGFGPCCACRGAGPTVRNLVTLPPEAH